MRLLLVVVVAGALAGSALAEDITFQFGGVIESVEPGIGGIWSDVVVGDEFAFTYVFDSETADSEPDDPTSGLYEGILSYDLQVGEAHQAGVPLPIGFISVFPETERYAALLTDVLTDLVVINIVDFEEGTLETDELPLTLDFDKKISTDFEFGTSTGLATGEIQWFVPEPAVLSLMALALPAVLRRRR